MNGINRVIIAGNLGADPKPFVSKDGKPYTTFNLAINRTWYKDGEKEKLTAWPRVTVFGRIGEICLEYLKKGQPVLVEGHLSTYEKEENGQRKWFTSITADSVEFLSSRRALA